MEYIYPTWDDIERMCEQLGKKCSTFNPEILIGISRGGLVPVRILSDILDNKNIAIMKIEFYKSIGQTKDFPTITQPLSTDVNKKNVLIVDDVADTGRSLAVAKEHIKGKKARDVKIAVLHYKPSSIVNPDYYIQKTTAWIVYPWEKREVKREQK